MKLQLVFAPNTILHATSVPIARIDSGIRQLVHDMETLLASCQDPEGVGLAAPQVGKSLRLFIVRQTPSHPLQVYINPEILKTYSSIGTKQHNHNHDHDDVDMLEGCLSVKNVWSSVDREAGVDVGFQTLTGEKQMQHVTGFEAHIIQHEIDHLNGILFTQRALEQGKKMYRIEKKGGKEEFVPIDL